VGECFLWYRPTRVVPDQRPLNGRCCCCCLRDWNFAAVNPKLPRLTSQMTAKNLCSGHGIPIRVFSKMFGVGIDHLDLKSVHSLMQPVVLPPVVNMSS